MQVNFHNKTIKRFKKVMPPAYYFVYLFFILYVFKCFSYMLKVRYWWLWEYVKYEKKEFKLRKYLWDVILCMQNFCFEEILFSIFLLAFLPFLLPFIVRNIFNPIKSEFDVVCTQMLLPYICCSLLTSCSDMVLLAFYIFNSGCTLSSFSLLVFVSVKLYSLKPWIFLGQKVYSSCPRANMTSSIAVL